MSTGVYIQVETKRIMLDVFLDHSSCVLKQDLILNLEFINSLGWPSQGVTESASVSTKVTDTSHRIWFYVDTGNPDPGSHSHIAGTLFAKTLPQYFC